MDDERPGVRICETCAEAEDLILRLQRSGCDMSALSVAGKNAQHDGQVAGCYGSGGRMKFWGMMGAFWGGVWGIFSGSAYFLIPDVGQVVVGGPLADATAAALEESVGIGGLSLLGVGLFSLGVPMSAVVDCEAALREDKFLVVAHPPASAKAREILLDDAAFAGTAPREAAAGV